MKALVAILSLSTSVAAVSAVYLATRTKPVTATQAVVSVQPTAASAIAPEARSVAPRTVAGERAELVGRLAAASELEVRAAASGSVLHARVDPGDCVEKGQTLVELENPALNEPVRQAEMALELAKSDLEAEQIRLASAEREREQPTARPFRGRGAGLQRIARAGAQQARARVAQAEAALAHAKQALGDSQIVAPIAGCVAERRVSVGDRVVPGMTLMRLADISTLLLVVSTAELESSPALPVTARDAVVTVDSLPDRQFVGRVSRSLGTDGQSGRSALTIEVANSTRQLRPGMPARVRLVSESYAATNLSTLERFGSTRRGLREFSDNTSDGDLIRQMLVSMKGLAVTLTVAADAQTKELTRKQEAAKVTVEATTQYFGQLERELVDLRPDNNSHHAVNLEKAADQVDGLPVLHVDEELLAFGADVAQSLRAMAERRRSISRTRTNSDVTLSDEAQIENSAIRTQGMQRITIGLANMRRKLTKKYNLEFLATNMHTASASTKRRTTRH
jgi:RND family efflux transporter MFP subunit